MNNLFTTFDIVNCRWDRSTMIKIFQAYNAGGTIPSKSVLSLFLCQKNIAEVLTESDHSSPSVQNDGELVGHPSSAFYISKILGNPREPLFSEQKKVICKYPVRGNVGFHISYSLKAVGRLNTPGAAIKSVTRDSKAQQAYPIERLGGETQSDVSVKVAKALSVLSGCREGRQDGSQV